MSQEPKELNEELTGNVSGGISQQAQPPKICPFCHKEVEFMTMSAGKDAEGNDRPHGLWLCPLCNKAINF